MCSIFLKTSLALGILIFLGSCMQRDDIPIPKEGDVVTWKFNNELVIKARLGQRREHIVDTDCPSCERDFYRPEYELYLGQFAIDYVPEKLTRAEVESMPMTPHKGQIEFNLRLNGAEFKATDRIIHSEKGLDDINQVKVVVEGQGSSYDPKVTTTHWQERVRKNKDFFYDDKISSELGLSCYRTRDSFGDSFLCFSAVTGFSFRVDDDWVMGGAIESIYGGIRVRYRLSRQNLKYWKNIEIFVWNLLACWNVAPTDVTSGRLGILPSLLYVKGMYLLG